MDREEGNPFGKETGVRLRSGRSLPAAPEPYTRLRENDNLQEEPHASSYVSEGGIIRRTPQQSRTPSVKSQTMSKRSVSVTSCSSRARVEEIECNLEEDLARLESQEEDCRIAMNKLNIEIECCEGLVKGLEDTLEERRGTEEEDRCRQDLQKARRDLQHAVKQKKLQQAEEDGSMNKIKKSKAILIRKAKLAKEIIQEENEQFLGSEEDEDQSITTVTQQVTSEKTKARLEAFNEEIQSLSDKLNRIPSEDQQESQRLIDMIAWLERQKEETLSTLVPKVTVLDKNEISQFESSDEVFKTQTERLEEFKRQHEQKMRFEIEQKKQERIQQELRLAEEQLRLQKSKTLKAIEDAKEAEAKVKEELDKKMAQATQARMELEEKLKNLDEGDKQVKNPEKSPSSNKVDEKTELIKMLAEVIKSSHPQNSATSDSNKFLARQSYAKVLPKFSGKPEDWPVFKSDFERSTRDCGFSHSENMGRLRKCLEGEAYKYVQAMMVSPDNVPQIMKDLEERYGQPEHIIRVMICKAKEVNLVSSDNLESLVEFGAAVRNFTATVRTLNRPEHLSNPQLQKELEDKLPTSLRMEWMQWATDDATRKPDLEHFSQWLGKKSAIACRICPFPNTREIKPEKSSGNDQQEKNANNKVLKKGNKKNIQVESQVSDDEPTAAGLAATTKRKQCIFCDMENHSSQKCFKAKKLTPEERSELVRKKKGCFRCLRRGHFSKFCTVSVTCETCGGRHETIMCRDDGHEIKVSWEYKDSAQERVPDAGKPKLAGLSINHRNNWLRRKVTMLKVAVVKVVGPKGTSTVRMLIDEGSQASYIGSRTVNKVGCRSLGVETVQNSLLGGYVTDWKEEHLREVTLTNLTGTVTKTLTLREIPTVCTTLPKIAVGHWLEPLRKRNILFTDLEGTNVDQEDIEILIGSDLRELLITRRYENLDEATVAEETIFGWVIGGPIEASKRTSNANLFISMFQERQHSIEDLWSLDLLGIKEDAQTKTKFQEEEEARKHFRDNVVRKDNGRYSVALPFINEKPSITSNFAISKKRLQNTTKKLQDKQAFETYDSIFRGWEKEGIVEYVQDEKLSESHYLPHHPVFKPESKTTPVRPVFDASCKSYNNPSLNDCLYKGPNLIELIPSVLNRFRERKLGVVSDIRKAFQMIEVREEDRDYQRFLWWEQDNKETLQIFRHARVVFGITSSPFLLGAVLDLHLNQVNEDERETAQRLLRSMYVDNSIVSLDTIDEYTEFREISTRVLAQAGMELREWQCTDEGVSGIDLSRTSERCGLETFTASKELETSVLGLIWDRREDKYDISNIDFKAPWTKRKLLSVVARVFDPIGYTCPATLPPKVIVQKMWKANKNWDEELEEEAVHDFEKWYSEIKKLADIRIPRRMVYCQDPEEVQLHLFSDACSYAYAAVIFIRSVQGSEVKVQLVQAKSRVAPVKGVTIPRLELMGCFIGVRLLDMVRESLDIPISKEYYWTDSTTAISWINRIDEWGTFVANRVKEIRNLTSPHGWRHVEGSKNPADLPSRGCSPDHLLRTKWWEGSEWLRDPEEEWPTMAKEVNEEEVTKEIKGRKKIILHVRRKEPWFNCKFSSFNQIVKVMGWVLRFITNCKKLTDSKDKVLSQPELKAAEDRILQSIQEECLVPDLQALTKKMPVVDRNGLLCIKTRLLNKDDTELFRWPVILPKDHVLVKALIQDTHVAYGHPGIQFLLCKLREKYWILGGRRAVKSIIRQCPRCRRHDAKPFEVITAALPEDRVTQGEVFQTTGVDLAGPVPLKEDKKGWIVLFTCAVYRCVHFDVVTSLSTQAFLGALERFINTYGRPSKFYSDNGTNFVGAANLMKSLDWKRLEAEFEVQAIKWTFNPPAAPWWGGWWERLVRSMKNQLRRILGKAKLTYDELRTSLSTVQSTMNDRPLTVMTEDSGDLIPLTPAMFLHPTRSSRFPEGDKLDRKSLGNSYKKMRNIQRQLQERFRSEYLSQLVQRGKEKRSPVPKVGDVVLIGSDDKKRFQWPLGLIVEIIPGRDREVRVAKVRTAHDYLLKKKKFGKWKVEKVKKGHVWTRPLQRLYPLEISSSEEVQVLKGSGKISKEVSRSQESPKMIEDHPSKMTGNKTRMGRVIKQPSRYGQWVTNFCAEDYEYLV